MKANFVIESPNDIECTITMTMQLKDWIELQGQLERGKWPAWEMSRTITDLVNQARNTFHPSREESEDE